MERKKLLKYLAALVIILLISILVVHHTKKQNKIKPIEMNVEVSVLEGDQRIIPNYYETTFDFNYNVLMESAVDCNEERLKIHLEDNTVRNIVVREEYYSDNDYTGQMHRTDYNVKKNDEDNFLLEMGKKKAGNFGIYYITSSEFVGTYVFKVIYE